MAFYHKKQEEQKVLFKCHQRQAVGVYSIIGGLAELFLHPASHFWLVLAGHVQLAYASKLL